MKYHTYIKAASILLSLFLLTGCLYPQNELAKNQIPNESQLEAVQSAVDTYRDEKNGFVPIKTKPNDTPIFEKYLIDFSLLKDANVLTEIPGNAYENGGPYQYALLNPEEDPQVKLIDLRITEEIRRVNVQLDLYRNEHLYPPYGETIGPDVFTIDYEKLGFDSQPYVKSPYSGKNLPIIMDMEGKLYVDYRIDFNEALEEYNHNYQTGDDIRYLLAENTPFLPAYSYPLTIEDDEPAFMEK